MTDADSFPAWLVPLILLGIPLVFAAMWTAISWLISRIGGWHRVAAAHPAHGTPTGRRFGWQSGRFGVASYNHVLTVHSGAEGLHLAVNPMFRIGHPPIFLPWTLIRNAQRRRFFFVDTIRFDVGAPSRAGVVLPAAVFEGAPIRI
jgi:hypothetical protein